MLEVLEVWKSYTKLSENRENMPYQSLQSEKFLKKQETYSMHRSANKKFRRNKVMVTGIDDQWEMDLMDMVLYEKENDNVRYVLLIIDVFSKFIWLRALKNKTGMEVKEAIRDVLKSNRKPSRVRTDKGKEFLANTVQRFFQAEDIKHFTSHNELKANISDRAKAKIQQYLTYKQTFRYIKCPRSSARFCK